MHINILVYLRNKGRARGLTEDSPYHQSYSLEDDNHHNLAAQSNSTRHPHLWISITSLTAQCMAAAWGSQTHLNYKL